MRRHKKLRESISVSLFPFLAVLICTFGVLIILLVLVVKVADQQAANKKQSVNDQYENEKAELYSDLEFQQLRVDGLRSVRPDLLKELQQARHQRALLQSRIESLKDEAESLNSRIRLVSNESAIDASATTGDEIRELQLLLETEMAKLQERRQSAMIGRPTLYSVVPHRGPDGTRRRPIYIECLKEKIVLQPHQIELTSSDFIRPIVANNPLDAALISVREYFLENQLNRVGETPYPLLIVRPSGADSYGVARQAIRSWDEEFGYELIAEDKQLDFGNADEQLKKRIQSAVDAARRRQRQYLAEQMLNRPMQNKSTPSEESTTRGGLHASSQLGGFVNRHGKLPNQRGNADSQGPATDDRTDSESTNANRASTESSMSASATGDGQGDSSMMSIAENKGNNWAVPKRNQDSVGYRRPIVIEINHDEMVIKPSQSNQEFRRIAFGASMSESAEGLVAQVWQQVERWGVAGVNGYWKPELVFRVADNGRLKYRQLVELMRGSGIEIHEVDQ